MDFHKGLLKTNSVMAGFELMTEIPNRRDWLHLPTTTVAPGVSPLPYWDGFVNYYLCDDNLCFDSRHPVAVWVHFYLLSICFFKKIEILFKKQSASFPFCRSQVGREDKALGFCGLGLSKVNPG